MDRTPTPSFLLPASQEMGIYDVRLVNKDKSTDAEKSKDKRSDPEIVFGVRATPHDVVTTSHRPVTSDRKDYTGNLIWAAADRSDSDTLKLFLDECKSEQNATSLMHADSKGRTPLHQAVQRKSIGIVKVLLKASANVVCADTEGRTPLHLAVQTKSIETIKVLLEAGAGVMKFDKNGKVRCCFLHSCALVFSFLLGC